MFILFYLIGLFNLTEQDYILKMNNEPEKVNEIFEEAIKNHPKSYVLYLRRAKMALKFDNYKDAQLYLKKAYNISADKDILLDITFTQIKLKQFNDLIKITDDYLEKEQNPDDEILIRRGYAFYFLKDYDSSLECFEKVKEKNQTVNDFIRNLQPKPSFYIYPMGGKISYKDNDIIDSFSYFGIYPVLNYGKYTVSGGYYEGNYLLKDKSEVTQKEYDGGIKYGYKHVFDLHFKYIDFEKEDAKVYFVGYGLNLYDIGFETSFAYSNYSSFNVYQAEFTPYMWLVDDYLKFGIGVGYKFFSDDKFDKTAFVQSYLNYYATKSFWVSLYLIYNEKTHFVSNKGLSVQSTGEEVVLNGNLTLNIKVKNFILSPYYQTYFYNGKEDFMNKYSYGLSLGFVY